MSRVRPTKKEVARGSIDLRCATDVDVAKPVTLLRVARDRKNASPAKKKGLASNCRHVTGSGAYTLFRSGLKAKKKNEKYRNNQKVIKARRGWDPQK